MADREELRDVVARALAEDLGAGDVTSEAVVPADATATARIVQKQPGVVFGLEVAAEAFFQAGAGSFEGLQAEGQWRDTVPADVALAGGPARALLAAERTALNLLCHLSGVATLTARFVDAVQRNRGDDPRHAQDHPRAAVAREGRGRRRRRAKPPHGPSRRDPDQGEPHRAFRRARRGGAPRPRGRAGPRDRGRVPKRRGGRVGPRRRRRPAPAGQHDRRRSCGRRLRCATRRKKRTARRRSSRPPAGSASTTSPKSPPPGSTSSRSAP